MEHTAMQDITQDSIATDNTIAEIAADIVADNTVTEIAADTAADNTVTEIAADTAADIVDNTAAATTAVTMPSPPVVIVENVNCHQKFAALAVDFDCAAPNAVELYKATLKEISVFIECVYVMLNDTCVHQYNLNYHCANCNDNMHLYATPCNVSLTFATHPEWTSAIQLLKKIALQQYSMLEFVVIDQVTLKQLQRALICGVIGYMRIWIWYDVSEAYKAHKRLYVCQCPKYKKARYEHDILCSVPHVSYLSKMRLIIEKLIMKHPLSLISEILKRQEHARILKEQTNATATVTATATATATATMPVQSIFARILNWLKTNVIKRNVPSNKLL